MAVYLVRLLPLKSSSGLLGIALCASLLFMATLQTSPGVLENTPADMNVNEVDVELMDLRHKITGNEEEPHFHMHHLYAEDTDWDRSLKNPSEQIPRVIHYVWCRPKNTSFTFNHFLSVLSTIRIVRPDAIYFHHPPNSYPVVDNWMYNTWFAELKYNYPWLVINDQHTSMACINNKPRVDFVLSKLRQQGGIYMALDTLITNFDNTTMPYDFVVATREGSEDYAMIAAKPNFDPYLNTIYKLQTHSKAKHKMTCPLAKENMKTLKKLGCLVLGPKARTPVELVSESTSDTPLYMFLRKLFHGQDTIPRLKPNKKEVIPNIGHYVWFGGGQMDYVFYLSVLSVLFVVEVDKVYIHGDKPPSGQYWQRLHQEETNRVKWVYRPHPKQIYETVVGRIEHAADVARHDIMLKYGGLNMDADVIFNRPIDRTLFHYDTVVTLDNYLYPMPPFPDTFNLGVVMNKPYSKFWQLYQFSERYYYEDDYTWNSNRVPYKIWERNPGLLHIDSELQVICCYLKCYPTWVKTREEAFQLSEDITPWKDRPMAFHWTWPSPGELKNEEVLRKNNSLFAQIGHRVLRAAGKW